MPRGIPNIRPDAEQTPPTRADEVRTERRKKRGAIVAPGIKLAVDESKLDRKTYEYRFANDKDGRVQQLMAGDWDPVHDASVKSDGSGLGSVPSAHAGVADGKPYKAVLLRKRKDWYQDDQKDKQRPLDEMDNAIRRGANQGAEQPELRGEGVYTPGGVNILE